MWKTCNITLFSIFQRYIKSIGLKAIFLQTDHDVPAYEFCKKNGFIELQGHVSFAKGLKD